MRIGEIANLYIKPWAGLKQFGGYGSRGGCGKGTPKNEPAPENPEPANEVTVGWGGDAGSVTS